MTKFNRRGFLLAILLAASFAADFAFAKDGESGGGSGNSGSGSNSGSSNENSDDDDDDDDGDDDDGDDESRGGSASGHSSGDHERALKAVKKGKAVSLSKLKMHLAAVYPGKILDVNLRKSSGDYFYNVRILAKGNRIKLLSLNALTLKPRGK
jgi:uncharacterized membrane protein YkoI